MMRILPLAIAAFLFSSASGVAPVEAARKATTTCAKLYKRCITYNGGYGPAEVKHCEEQRAICMQTGEWHSPAFDVTDVKKE